MRSPIIIKLTLWIALLGILSAAVSVYMTYINGRNLLIQATKDRLSTATNVLTNRYVFFIDDIGKDLSFISKLPAIEEIATNNLDFQQQQKIRLSETLANFLSAHPEYTQIRIIDANNYGKEIVRIDKLLNNPQIIQRTGLQEKAHFPYVYKTLMLNAGEIFVSSIRLNRERGILDGYNKPTVTLATPIYTQQNILYGIVVINVDLAEMFSLIQTDIPSGIEVIATNEEGDYLIHPDKEKTFGFDNGKRFLIQNDVAASQRIFSGEENNIVAEITDLKDHNKKAVIALRKVSFNKNFEKNYITLGLITPLDKAIQESINLGIDTLKISLLFCAFLIGIAFVLARKISKPLHLMAKTFGHFKEGDSIPELAIDSNDELGLLARNFSAMAKKLNAQLLELNNQHQYLHMVAHHDSLTGLPNRILLEDRMDQALLNAKRDKHEIAIIIVDLDDFKPVNDLYGHDSGDLLLREAAQRMLNCVRESDTVARLGGDEFMVIVSGRDTKGYPLHIKHIGRQVAEKIRNAIERPFLIENHTVNISCSVGIAIYPTDGTDKMMLAKNADAAMYHAKSSGRNNVKIYSDIHTL